jgi:hypothetical protein
MLLLGRSEDVVGGGVSSNGVFILYTAFFKTVKFCLPYSSFDAYKNSDVFPLKILPAINIYYKESKWNWICLTGRFVHHA